MFFFLKYEWVVHISYGRGYHEDIDYARTKKEIIEKGKWVSTAAAYHHTSQKCPFCK